MTGVRRKLLEVLNGATVTPPPIWLMRQAGRYLPEYRETRKQAGSFLQLCYSPELATEVTLQPIRRYGFDAAILFSDILVIPDALRRNVRFVEGEGPRMDPIDEAGISHLDGKEVLPHLAPVMQAVSSIRASLPGETTLLGFCGAPWTVATYMIAGRGTPDQAPARLFSYRHRKSFEHLLAFLADVSADYLVAQIDAGADAVQIFDSWAGVLGESEFEEFAIKPVARMISSVKARRPQAKIIAFAKGAGLNLKNYRQRTGADMMGWIGQCLSVSRLIFRKMVRSRAISTRCGSWPVERRSMMESTPYCRHSVKDHWFSTWDTELRPKPILIMSPSSLRECGDTVMPHEQQTDVAPGQRAAVKAAVALTVFLALMALPYFLVPDQFYLWAKAFHVIAVISWMAGLFYMPRLFIYHTDSPVGSAQSETFKVMEKRLLKVIMNPAMMIAWVLGLYLAWEGFRFQGGWLHAKILAVILLTLAHVHQSFWVRQFAKDGPRKPARYWRMMNEIPTLLMILIVILVIVKPFA